LIKILVNITGDIKLHLSWQLKKWNMEIWKAPNIKEIDLQNDSIQGGFCNTK